MPLTIIESPYKAKGKKLQARNILYAQLAVLDSIGQGETPLASHLLYTQMLNDRKRAERNRGLKLSKDLIDEALYMAVYVDLGNSVFFEGMASDLEGLAMSFEWGFGGGADHRGTRLSRVPVDRVLRDADDVVRATLAAGEIVSCDLCHSLEKSFED